METLNDVRLSTLTIIDKLRELQEKAAVEEMYEFFSEKLLI